MGCSANSVFLFGLFPARFPLLHKNRVIIQAVTQTQEHFKIPHARKLPAPALDVSDSVVLPQKEFVHTMPVVQNRLVAGGGFKGGQVVGASDARGEEVKDRPVYPADLLATIYGLMGIDTEAKLPHPLGLDTRVVPSPSEGVKMAGPLKEIV